MPLTTLKASNFVDDSVTVGKLSASGTASSSTYLRGDNTWTAVSGLSGLYNASTQTDYTVTVASSKFVIDSVSQATLTLTEGYTYMFDVSDSTVSTHILRFATAADAAGSTEYTYGVQAVGTPGSAGAKVYFTVPIGAPGLFYYCTAHSGMGGTANTSAATTKTAGDMYVDRGRLTLVSGGDGITRAIWTVGDNIITARAGAFNGGTQNSGYLTSGWNESSWYNSTEEYSGVAWTLGGNSLQNRRNGYGGMGTQSAGLIATGYSNSPTGTLNTTEEYDGSSWSSANTVPTALYATHACGTQTAGLGVGGYNMSTTCQEYDGTSWTAGGALSTGTHGNTASGIQTAALKTGGASYNTTTEEYNGTSWSGGGSSYGPNYGAGAGTSSSASVFGGDISGGTYMNWSYYYDGQVFGLEKYMLWGANNQENGMGSANRGFIALGGVKSGGAYSTATQEYSKSTIEFVGQD